MKLTPVQRVVFKLIEGIPLDDVEKFPVCSFEPHPDGVGVSWVENFLTEKGYVEKLQMEGRCHIPADPVDSNGVKLVCLVAGRRSGKNVLISEVVAAELARRVVAHEGPDVLGLLTVSTGVDQAGLLLQNIIDVVSQWPELKARVANMTQRYYGFQTDDDIRCTGTWEGSQRKARASVQIHAKSSQGLWRGMELGLFCLDEPDFMCADQAAVAWRTLYPALHRSAGTAMVAGSPYVKGFMRALFGQPHVLSLRIPAWEMNPMLYRYALESAYRDNPTTFWAEFGACWLEEARGLRAVGTPAGGQSRVGGAMTPLNDIGTRHQAWQDQNFDGISLLTQGLVLAEECGEVARAIVKAHHGIREHDRGNLADELADVILVATSLATRAGIDLDEAVFRKAAKRDLKDFRARPGTG